MIKSAMKVIKAILGDADVFDEKLYKATYAAERFVNSWPMTLSVLTPKIFLH